MLHQHLWTGTSPAPGRGVFGSLSGGKTGSAKYIFGSGLASILFICVSILGPGTIEQFLQDGIRGNVVWQPNSPSPVDDRFRGPADPNDPHALGTVFSVWLWNITNVDEIRAGAKPDLDLVGPFKYRRIRRKVDVWWDRDGRVAVKEWSYYLEPLDHTSATAAASASSQVEEAAPDGSSSSSSSGSSRKHHRQLSGAPAATAGIGLDHAAATSSVSSHKPPRPQEPDGPAPDIDAPIVTLNLPLIGVIEAIHGNVGPAAARLLDLLVAVIAGWKDDHINGLFVKRSARELIWGYEDPLLKALASVLPSGTVPRTFVSLVHNMTGPEEALALKPSIYDTGRDNLQNVWNLLQDTGVSRVTSWPQGGNCSAAGERVWGTDAFQFSPGVRCHTPGSHGTTPTTLRIWVSDLYRGGNIMCSGKEWLYGIKLLRFMPDPAQARTPDPCHDERIAGLMNITRPTAAGAAGNGSNAHGTPLYLSMPHFCGSDPSLRDGVEGLAQCGTGEGWDAIPLDFATYIDIEPITGIPMRAAKRVQLSSEMGHMALKHLEPRINESTIYPILIGSEEVTVAADQASMFKKTVYWARRVQAHLRIWSLLCAVVAVTACIALLVAEASHREAAFRQEERAREEEARRVIQESAARRRRELRRGAQPEVSTTNGQQQQEQEGSDGKDGASEPQQSNQQPVAGQEVQLGGVEEQPLLQPLLPAGASADGDTPTLRK